MRRTYVLIVIQVTIFCRQTLHQLDAALQGKHGVASVEMDVSLALQIYSAADVILPIFAKHVTQTDT